MRNGWKLGSYLGSGILWICAKKRRWIPLVVVISLLGIVEISNISSVDIDININRDITE